MHTEIRSGIGGAPQLRRGSDGATISGYASVFFNPNDPDGTQFELWPGTKERIARGAFDRALKEGQDVRALFNHDPSLLLARSASNTLRLSTDTRGLRYEFTVPDHTIGQDVAVMLERGDLAGSSFGFTVAREQWHQDDNGDDVRTILEIGRLFDVSPVSFPAYTGTTAGVVGNSGRSSPPPPRVPSPSIPPATPHRTGGGPTPAQAAARVAEIGMADYERNRRRIVAERAERARRLERVAVLELSAFRDREKHEAAERRRRSRDPKTIDCLARTGAQLTKAMREVGYFQRGRAFA